MPSARLRQVCKGKRVERLQFSVGIVRLGTHLPLKVSSELWTGGDGIAIPLGGKPTRCDFYVVLLRLNGALGSTGDIVREHGIGSSWPLATLNAAQRYV